MTGAKPHRHEWLRLQTFGDPIQMVCERCGVVGDPAISQGGLVIDDDMMTVRQAASILGLSPVTIRRAYREGRLEGRKISNPGFRWSVILVTEGSVERYRANHLGRRGGRR